MLSLGIWLYGKWGTFHHKCYIHSLQHCESETFYIFYDNTPYNFSLGTGIVDLFVLEEEEEEKEEEEEEDDNHGLAEKKRLCWTISVIEQHVGFSMCLLQVAVSFTIYRFLYENLSRQAGIPMRIFENEYRCQHCIPHGHTSGSME
jgi:hypothetical protein